MSSRGDGSSSSSDGLFRRDFQAVMLYDYCYGKSYQQRFQSMRNWFGGQSLSNVTVNRRYRHFRSGQASLEDNDRCGQISTSVTRQNFSRVESMIKEDPKLAYTEIQDIMKISSGGLHATLHDFLVIGKRYAR
mgnify:CR=1 FL=1